MIQDFFFIKAGDEFVRIDFNEILYIQNITNAIGYCKLVTEKKTYRVRVPIYQWHDVLPEELFPRLHRTYIVSLKKIISFDRECVNLQNITLPLGTSHRLALLRKEAVFPKHLKMRMPVKHLMEEYSNHD